MFKIFNKDNVSIARIKVQKTLDELGKEIGCTFKMGHIRYGDFGFRTKLEVKLNSPEANVVKADVPSWFPINKIVMIRGIQFKISGYNPRSYKKPVQLTRVRDGKEFKTTLLAAGITKTW